MAVVQLAANLVASASLTGTLPNQVKLAASLVARATFSTNVYGNTKQLEARPNATATFTATLSGGKDYLAKDLVFFQSPAVTSPIDLEFGAVIKPIPKKQITAYVALPEFPFTASATFAAHANMNVVLPEFTTVMSLKYDKRVTHYLQGKVADGMNPAIPRRPTLDAKHNVSLNARGGVRHPWDTGAGRKNGLNAVHRTSVSKRPEVRQWWDLGTHLSPDNWFKYDVAVKLKNQNTQGYDVAAHRKMEARHFMQTGINRRYVVVAPHQTGVAARPTTRAMIGASFWRQGPSVVMPWNMSQKLPAGFHALTPVDPTNPDLCYIVSPNLRFSPVISHSPALLFHCDIWTPYVPPPPPTPHETVVVPVQGVYFVINSLSLTRVSNNTDIPVKNVSVSIDRDTWAWGFTATCPKTAKDSVNPSTGPVEVELVINGFTWRFLIERMTENIKFGETSLSVSGRSVTAYLDDPFVVKHSYIQSQFWQSRAFVENILARTDAPAGYTVDWNLGNTTPLLGWGMPAGAYSYQDKTHMQAIKEIVEGVKGFVMSHPSSKQLLVRSRYPYMPWEIAAQAADVEVPNSIMRTRSVEMMQSPAYDGVYVSGENVGVARFVKRTGTAGSTQPPMYVNKMITDSDAAREAGRAILAACGRRARVGVQMPLLSTTPLMVPGTLLSVVDGGYGDGDNWKGWVNGIGIQASWSEGLTISQTLDVERRYVEAV